MYASALLSLYTFHTINFFGSTVSIICKRVVAVCDSFETLVVMLMIKWLHVRYFLTTNVSVE